MSDLAEYARNIHEKESQIHKRELIPVKYESKITKLTDIRAAIFDIYGTIINYWRPGFGDKQSRTDILANDFLKLINRFGMEQTIREINPKETPEKTLSEFYHGLIALNHQKASEKGREFPEVKIEEIWGVILMILKRRGYEFKDYFEGSQTDFARYLAFTYNFYALGRQLYPGVVEALEELKSQNIALGILSNAQFYTPMDLTLMIRDQSKGKYDDFSELFDVDLTFFSYEYGIAKPDQLLYRRLYDALYEYHILPSQTVVVGNDLLLDIKPAEEIGMHTAFFCGDSSVAFMHDLYGEVIPDISFSSWEELPLKVSFHSQESGS